MSEFCPECEREFKSVGHHWAHNPSHRPNITDRQMDITTGLLMGDGCLQRPDDTHPSLRVNTISKDYLQYLDKIFGYISRGVSLQAEADTQEEYFRDSFGRGCNASDVYRWYTCSHPELERFTSWYDSGKKVWPKDIDLTPTVLKHWYCGDGSMNRGGQIYISMSNEIGNEEKVEKYFKRVDIPQPNNWQTHDVQLGTAHNAVWNVEESKELREYMGEPLPGFEYKWKISEN